jgi:hypothetical protein
MAQELEHPLVLMPKPQKNNKSNNKQKAIQIFEWLFYEIKISELVKFFS